MPQVPTYQVLPWIRKARGAYPTRPSFAGLGKALHCLASLLRRCRVRRCRVRRCSATGKYHGETGIVLTNIACSIGVDYRAGHAFRAHRAHKTL